MEKERILVNGRPMLEMANDMVRLSEGGLYTKKASFDEVYTFLWKVADAMGLEMTTEIFSTEDEAKDD